MSSDSGRVEETEEPQQVIPEPSMDQRETPGDPEPGLFTPQTSPVETSQLVSAQSQVVPTCDETAVTSESCSTGQNRVVPTHHEPAMTSQSLPPTSRANPGKDSDFQPGETSETVAFQQAGASADQPIKEEDRETPVSGAQASDSSQSAPRTSEDFVPNPEGPVLICVPDPCLEGLVFEDPYCGTTYTIPAGGMMGAHGPRMFSFPSRSKGAHKKVPVGKRAVMAHPSRKPQRAQENYGQQIASQLQNIGISESSAPSGEGSHETQMVSGGSSVPSHSPSASRQPPESGSDSPAVQRVRPQKKSDPEDQSAVSQKKPRN